MDSHLLFSFKDCDVYEHHAGFFHDCNWLDDVCINLCFKLFEESESIPNVLLMDPAVVSFISSQIDGMEEFEDLCSGLKLNSYRWIVFPLTDSKSLQQRSSHWSLLICDRQTLQSFYLDSAGELNFSSTKRFYSKLTGFFQKKPRKVAKVSVPSQTNGYDCGIYAVLFAQRLAKFLNSNELDINSIDDFATNLERVVSSIVSSDATQFREMMLRKIEELTKSSQSTRL